MEANQNNKDTIPEFEQQIEDTRIEQNNPDRTFEKNMGLPIHSSEIAPEQVTNPAQAVQNQGVEPQAPPAEVPPPDFSQNEVAPTDNDKVRYQYWQSQAAKLQNQVQEYEKYAPMVDYLRNNPEAVKQVDTAQHAEPGAVPTEGETEAFPPPPEKPAPPVGFNRDEAINDPASTSAQYVAGVEQWRDDMLTYNNLSAQYEIAGVREEYQQKIGELEKIELKRKEGEAAQQEMGRVRSFVNKRYNLQGDDLDNFINTMNDPNSINMDDLVGYYQFKKGNQGGGHFPGTPPAPQPPRQNTPKPPSANFRQVQRAQSVPQPMGVQSATSTEQQQQRGFMDLLIDDNNKQNIL